MTIRAHLQVSQGTKRNHPARLGAAKPCAIAPAFALRRTVGNQAVQRLLHTGAIQAKLRISQPNDSYEQDADCVADRVMRMPDPQTEEKGTDCPACAGADSPCATCRDRRSPKIHRRAELPAGHRGASVPNNFLAQLGRGQPLDPGTRAFFEPKFGHDFGDVRVHADSQADRSAREINAVAFTAGKNIVFRAGKYEPDSAQGRRLLAHELTHTIQQGAVRADRPGLMSIDIPGGQVQREAAPPAPDPGGGLTDEMLRQIARRLREAMQGWGTDEDAIYAAMAGRTQPQVDAIARVYAAMYGRALIDDLRDELTDAEMLHLALFSPTAAPEDAGKRTIAFADMVARQLDSAMDRVGTDEEAIYAALTGRTADERRQIKEAYLRLTHRELEQDLRSELSRSELTHALMLLNQGLLQPEDELYLAMAGLGTDEATVFRVLSSLVGNVAALTNLEADYKRKYGDLVQDLRSDLSSSEYQRARGYILPTILDADVQGCGAGATPAQTTRSVREAHARAVWMLKFALARSHNISDPAVQAAALRYFKITLPATTRRDAYFWAFVRRALNSLTEAEIGATYECEPEQSLFHGFCISNNVAVTIFNIHLCPEWWTHYTNVDERAGVLIHEWGHRYGTGVATIFETYCDSGGYASASTADLVTWPDAYMQFIYDLSIGSPAPCF